MKNSMDKNFLFRELKWFAVWFIFLFMLVFFLFEWSTRAFSRYPLEQFDEAMRAVSRSYVSAGFVPYRDFGIQYPPGVFILAHIIPFKTLEQQNIVVYSLFPVIVLVAAVLLRGFRQSVEKLLLSISGFMMVLILVLHDEDVSDPLVGLLMITVVRAIRFGVGKIAFFLLFFFAFLAIHWRWDRVLTFLFIESVLFLSYITWCWRCGKRSWALDTGRILLAQGTGVLCGVVSIGIYLVFHGGLTGGFDFIYRLPVIVTLPYRDLPLSPFFSYWGELYLYTWIALFLFILYTAVESIRLYRHTSPKNIMISLFLILAPFSGLPYALGRSDGTHIHPMVFFTGLCIVLALMVTTTAKKQYALLGLFLIVSVPTIRHLTSFFYVPFDRFSMTKILNQSLHECKAQTDAIKYSSLFVGRTVYEQYFSNNVALYLLNPSVPPATRYITDDPGIHNSCDWGERVKTDLEMAPRPMLAFITDQRSERREENKTKNMKSCGTIEGFLTKHPYRVLGTCTSYEVLYEIRIYD